MEINISVILGILTIIFVILTFYFARKKDSSDSASQSATIIVELQTVRRDIGEMKGEVQAMRHEWRTDHDKLVGMERDIKAIWKQVDQLNGKDNDE